MWTHRERWERLFPDREVGILCRGDLAPLEREAGHCARVVPGGESESGARADAPDTLFIAAALGRPSPKFSAEIRTLEAGVALLANGRLVAARASGDRAARLIARLMRAAGRSILDASRGDPDPAWSTDLAALGFDVRDTSAPADAAVPATLADLVSGSASAIAEDFEAYVHAMPEPAAHAFPGTHFLRPERIRLGGDVRVDPGVVLDARDGPILIGPDVHVMSNAVIAGPVAIGRATLVKPGARIAHATCIGPVCKVGGEIEGSIVQGFSNKQHDGFLGHSYLGSWVNLGAATDTSDLKNNYGEVRIVVAGREIATGSRHVGSFIGDHSKTGIHTMLNTGTVVGAFANVFGAGFPPRKSRASRGAAMAPGRNIDWTRPVEWQGPCSPAAGKRRPPRSRIWRSACSRPRPPAAGPGCRNSTPSMLEWSRTERSAIPPDSSPGRSDS